MNEELREAIGKALYEASRERNDPTWDELSKMAVVCTMEWEDRAEQVIEAYKDWIAKAEKSEVSR